MVLIGVTGGIGAGKSEVLRDLKDRWQAEVLEMDTMAKELMQKGGRTYPLYLDLLGPGILDEDGEIDRAKTAHLLFGNPELLAKLNETIRPVIKEELFLRVAALKEKGTRLAVIEAALLIEEHYNEICDELWYIYADKTTRCCRLKTSRGYDDKRIEETMKRQLTDQTFRKYADLVIDNSGEFSHTQSQIDDRLKSLFSKGKP